jgi:predicted esterase
MMTKMTIRWTRKDVLVFDRVPCGVLGFSQGAALAGMLAASLEPSRAWGTAGLATTHEPLAFAVCYSGFRAPGERCHGFYEPPISTPILHFIGSLDTVVEESSIALVDV